MKQLLLAVALLAAIPAFADEIITDFKFDGNRGNIGKIEVFAVGPLALTLSGYSAPLVLADMWEKNQGFNETGIGLADNPHHEIGSSEFVQVNLTKILAFHPQTVSVTIDSILPGEAYDVWGSTTPGQLGTLLAADVSSANFTLSTSFPLISISGGGDSNVLLHDVTADFVTSVPTPEPSTAFLLLTGVFGLSIWEAKRKRTSL